MLYGMSLEVPDLHAKHDVGGPVNVKLIEKARFWPFIATLSMIISSIPVCIRPLIQEAK
jgi:hypothetical protein